MYDLLVISDDVAGEKMAGPGIRAWELSKTLARHFKVALAVPDYSSPGSDPAFSKDLPFGLFAYSQANPAVLKDLGTKSRIILFQGYILSKFPFLKDLAAYLICDLYVPFPLENLFVHREKVPRLADREFIHLNDLRVYNDQLLHADHFLCASERQRDLFAGSLLSLDRINPEILDLSPSLDDLISVVPFGITPDDEPEAAGERVIRGRRPGIAEGDIVLLWGGVIPNGFDPAAYPPDVAPRNDRFVLTCVGRLYGGRRDPSPLFSAVRELLDERVFGPADFEIRFFGAEKDIIRKRAAAAGIPDVVRCHDEIPFRESLRKQKESSALLLLRWPTAGESIAIPGKLFEYLGAGRPILSIPRIDGPSDDLIKEADADAGAENREEAKRYLKQWFLEYKEKGHLPYHGREEIIRRYTRERQAAALAFRLDHLGPPNGASRTP